MGRETILIADDDKDLLEGLSFLFRSEGCRVISAEDGISAVNIAQAEDPDPILLDLSLSWVDGYKGIERLRSPASASSTPIIVLTGKDASINQGRAIKAGAKAFLHKPFDNDELFPAVKEILEEGRSKKK